MITRLITNHIKEGHKEAYIAASKAFAEALIANNGCLSCIVYEVEGDDTLVINYETWPDQATADAVTGTSTFREFLPQLVPHFCGNETWIVKQR